MNRYTLDAEGHRWWWVSGAAGAAAATVVTALLAAPLTGSPASAFPTGDGGPAPVTAPVDPGSDPAGCPSLPDPRYVGGPWAHDVPGCPAVSNWWKHVEHR